MTNNLSGLDDPAIAWRVRLTLDAYNIVHPAAKKRSDADFARLLDISPQRLSNWLTGDNGIPKPYLAAVARITGVPPEWLYAGDMHRLRDEMKAAIHRLANEANRTNRAG